MECCNKPRIKDLSQGIGPERHLYCQSCQSHTYKGIFYSKLEWDEWINTEDDA